MKNNFKILFITLLISTYTTICFGQLKKENIIIEANHGLLGGKKGLVFSLLDNPSITQDIDVNNLSTNYIGPIGGRIEYIMDTTISIGLDVNYTSRYASWRDQRTDRIYNEQTDQYETILINDEYSLSQKVFRVMVRLNYIFVNEKKHQIFWGNSIGYRLVRWDLEANDAAEVEEVLTLSIWPLAFRTALGVRYWFIPNVGINSEIGVSGGAYINAGLSIKL